MSKTVIVYSDKAGKEPFTEWLERIKDVDLHLKLTRDLHLKLTRLTRQIMA